MTTALVFVAIALAGGVGAALRFVVDGVVRPRVSAGFPVSTAVINVSGSLGLGLLTGLAAHAGLPHPVLLIAGGGLLGGYTTFSTASVETVRLAQQGRVGAALANGLGVLVLAVAAAALGLWLGSL